MQKMKNGRYPSRSRRINLYRNIRKDIKSLLEQYEALGCTMDSGMPMRLKETLYQIRNMALEELKAEIDSFPQSEENK